MVGGQTVTWGRLLQEQMVINHLFQVY